MREVISDQDKRLLINGIRLAATNKLDWRWFLADLHRISGGSKVHLTSLDIATDLPIDAMHAGFDPNYMESLQQYYGALNLWAQRYNKVPLGKLLSTRQLVSDQEMQATEFYHDWLKPQENATGGAAVTLAQSHNRRFLIGGVVRCVDREVLEPRLLAILKFLLPHFREALEINKILGGQSLNDHIQREGMQLNTAACFLLSFDRRLIFANSPAQTLINNGTVVRSNPRSELNMTDSYANRNLASAIFSFAQSDTMFVPPFFSGPPGSAPTYICRAIKLDPRDDLPAPYPFDRNASDFTLLLMNRLP